MREFNNANRWHHRLVLYGLNTEMLHAMLVRLKREQAARDAAAAG